MGMLEEEKRVPFVIHDRELVPGVRIVLLDGFLTKMKESDNGYEKEEAK